MWVWVILFLCIILHLVIIIVVIVVILLDVFAVHEHSNALFLCPLFSVLRVFSLTVCL